MNASLPLDRLSIEDYLKLETDGRLRHEYVAGETFAMTGASLEHNLIAGNIFRLLSNHLHGGPCRTFMSDFKVRLKNNMDDIFYYPDVMVACGNEGIEKYYLRNPKLVVEVLSPATEAVDRREKLIHYRRVASLEEYVLVAQHEPEVTIHRRSDEWEPTVITSLESPAQLRSVGMSVTLREFYQGVTLSSDA